MIRKKPTAESVIAKGGRVASSDEIKTIPLRLKESLLAQIDEALEGEPIKIPRNTWLLQAILEKLERD